MGQANSQIGMDEDGRQQAEQNPFASRPPPIYKLYASVSPIAVAATERESERGSHMVIKQV